MGLFSDIAGDLFGTDDQVDALKSSQERLGQLEGVGEGVLEGFKQEGKATRGRLNEAAGEQQAGLQGFEQQLAGELSGTQALQDDVTAQLRDVLGGNFENTPGYEFMREEALRGTRREMAAGGFGKSGNILTALQDRATGLASSEYSNIIGNLQGLLSTSGQLTGQGRSQRADLQRTGAGIYSDLFRTGEGISSDMFTQGQGTYAGMMQTSKTGQAQADIGIGQAKAAGKSALTGLIMTGAGAAMGGLPSLGGLVGGAGSAAGGVNMGAVNSALSGINIFGD